MTTPGWYALILLALAAYRIWRLIALDDVLDWPRRRLLRIGKAWKQDGDPLPRNYRRRLGGFLACPHCFGFWLALAWWGGYQFSPHWTLIAAAPWAISTLVGAAAGVLSR